jgi:glycolate oxidase
MKSASKYKIPVTPRGSGTGLCGAAVPIKGGIVMAMQRMNKVLRVSVEDLWVDVQAGCIYNNLNEELEKYGFFFPPSPGSAEACQVGGMVATDASGMRAVKYGVTRDYVRALTVVLPNGEVVELGGKIAKNSSGYSLKDLIVGSEGTLGIVARATLRLLPLPKAKISLLVPFPDLSAAIRTVPEVIRAASVPTAVEFMEREVILAAEKFQARKFPDNSADAYLLLTFDGASQEEVNLAWDAAAKTCLANGAKDVFISDTPERNESI